MNRTVIIFCSVLLLTGCKTNSIQPQRIALAEVGKVVLYYDQVPQLIQKGVNDADSAALFQNFINKWAKKQLILQKAEDNLSSDAKNEIEKQLEETRSNLLIYRYQQQMIIEKMDTLVSDTEMEEYYANNEKAFLLTTNIVKVLFIKLPFETPDLNKIKELIRSNDHKDLLQLEGLCYQFAEKFEDFNEDWITMDQLIAELHTIITDQENFLKRNTFLETNDSTSTYLVSIRDYRLRSSLAPFEYVKNDIKRVIWNTRRFEFIQSLENGIYNDALKDNSFKIY
jgi:hypothetical protein